MSFQKSYLEGVSGQWGRNNEYHENYMVWGTVSDGANDIGPTLSWLLNQTAGFGQIPLTLSLPGTTFIGYLADITYEKIKGNTAWIINAVYVPPSVFIGGEGQLYAFNTSGGTQHIQAALAHLGWAVPATSSITEDPNPDGLLGIESDGTASGMDRDVALSEFQIEIHILGNIASYRTLLELLTDTVNISPISGSVDGVTFSYDIGECRFKGATGARRGFGDMAITLNFAVIKNGPVKIASIPGLTKQGWDYNQVVYEPTSVGGKVIAPRIKYVSLDQIYPQDDWTGLIPGVI